MDRNEDALPTRVTDSIPRAAIEQILQVTGVLSDGMGTFDNVRQLLHRRSSRKAPASREAMWTVARDALSDLQKLGYATVGLLPRKRSEVDRLRETPCKLTESGFALARLFGEKQWRARAFDELLVAWMNDHPYFQLFTQRLVL